MKERRKTEDFFHEFDASVGRMEEYVRALEVETHERAALINLLEQADLFYETQRGEFKVVCTVMSMVTLKISVFMITVLLRLINSLEAELRE